MPSAPDATVSGICYDVGSSLRSVGAAFTRLCCHSTVGSSYVVGLSMGIYDFIKGGVRRMMIARPDATKSAIVYKHPDESIPFWSQLTVDSDELALFFKDGRYVGYLTPGRHSLDGDNIPFLGGLLDAATGGNVLLNELYFVTTRALYNQPFGGSLGSMRDPELDVRVNPRVYGSYSFRIVHAPSFVMEFLGQAGASDPDQALQWVRDHLMMAVRTTLVTMLEEGSMTMMDLGTAGPEVARHIVRNCPDLSRIGVSVLEIGALHFNLSDSDRGRLDQLQDQIAQAQVAARVASIAQATAHAAPPARLGHRYHGGKGTSPYTPALEVGCVSGPAALLPAAGPKLPERVEMGRGAMLERGPGRLGGDLASKNLGAPSPTCGVCVGDAVSDWRYCPSCGQPLS